MICVYVYVYIYIYTHVYIHDNMYVYACLYYIYETIFKFTLNRVQKNGFDIKST